MWDTDCEYDIVARYDRVTDTIDMIAVLFRMRTVNSTVEIRIPSARFNKGLFPYYIIIFEV